MRAGGINWLAVLVAAIAIYAIGFVIYGMLVPADTWMAWSGETEEQLNAANRMAYGPLMPIMTAAFLAVLFKLGNVGSAGQGAQWAAVVVLASAIPGMFYGWVYGTGPIEMTLVDSGHLLLGHVAAGAVLGGWK